MRALLLAALLAHALPSAARADDADDLGRASEMMAANWRPFQPPTNGGAVGAAYSRACEGALDEMTWLDGRLPETITPEALSAIRTPRGLVLVPTDEDPATFFLFAAANMPGLASGLATIRVANARQGHVDLIDAAGTQLALQLGTAGGHALMLIFGNEDQEPLQFVACASTAR